MNDCITIPIPLHPNDRELPLSVIQLKLPSGAVAALTLPIQGERTLGNAIKTLMVWKDSIVISDDYSI